MLPFTVDDLRLFLHVLAATVWVGGQITLAGLVPVLRRAGADIPKAAANGFARVAWPAFGVLILTGLWNVSAEHEQISASSIYRNTLIAKLILVALSGIAAFAHARATTKVGLAVWGAATGLFAMAALLFGLVLSHG